MKRRLFKMLALWMVGRTLPRPAALQGRFDALLRAIFLMVLAALCAGAALITGLFFSFRWLVDRGMAESAVFLLGIAVTLSAGIAAYLFSVREGNKAVDIGLDLDFFGHHPGKGIIDSASVLVQEFMAGLREEPRRRRQGFGEAFRRGYRRKKSSSADVYYVHEAVNPRGESVA